uniref:SCAN box domain-containing protein n=1 Tax=Astyanax mexicanus TaxID=7994 RepID=A0A8B9REN1_ASTMX
MVNLWLKGPLNTRLPSNTVKRISENLYLYIPEEFARKTRPLSEVARWKATEFRQFLLYTGPVVLMTQLLRVSKRWLQPDQLGPEAVTEQVTMDHFLCALPGVLRKSVGLTSPTSIKEMIDATEAAESVLSLGRSERTGELM